MRRYLPSDLPALESWFQARGMRVSIPPQNLSDTGLIEPDTAVGFLYLTNSTQAYVDCLLTNPKAKGERRYQAMNDIIPGLIEIAKKYGKELVVVLVNNPPWLGRLFQEHGFNSTEESYKYMARRI